MVVRERGKDERSAGGTMETTGSETRTTRQEMDTSRVCSCGTKYKNEKGLKIRRIKMGCSVTPILERRTWQPYETKEEMNQESHHSVQHLHRQEEEVADNSEAHNQPGERGFSPQEGEKHQEEENLPTPRIKWPTAASDCIRLHSALAGDVDRNIKAASTIIYAMQKDRFGIKDHKKQGSQRMKENIRMMEISKLRKEQRNLIKCYKKAERHEQEAIKELRDSNRERTKTLRRAENLRNSRRERARKRSLFTSNPFGFVKKLLGDKRSGRLDWPKEEVERYLRDIHLGDQHRLISPDEPTVDYDMSEPKLNEVKSVLKKARAASAPGPNGIPSKVYKNCPKLKTHETTMEAYQSSLAKKSVTRRVVKIGWLFYSKGGKFKRTATV